MNLKLSLKKSSYVFVLTNQKRVCLCMSFPESKQSSLTRVVRKKSVGQKWINNDQYETD